MLHWSYLLIALFLLASFKVGKTMQVGLAAWFTASCASMYVGIAMAMTGEWQAAGMSFGLAVSLVGGYCLLNRGTVLRRGETPRG